MKPSGGGGGGGEVRVVDSRSCRQLYLRSAYTFSRHEEEDNKNMKERAKKWLNRFTMVYNRRSSGDHNKTYNYKLMTNKSGINIRNKVMVINVNVSKVKHFSCASLLSMFRRMLACTVKVDA